MFSAVWNLIPIGIKIKLGIALFILIGSTIGYFMYLSNELDNAQTTITTLKSDIAYRDAIYTSELEKARKTISEQNDEITNFRLDKESYEKKIIEKEKELLESKIKGQMAIDEELKKDNSCENQLRIMTNILEGFSEGK